MKKILCLLLCVCAVFCFASCAEQEQDENSIVDAPRDAVTINFWIVTEEETTPEAQEAMAEAFNLVTEADYTTHVEFVFCTEDEYKAKLDAKFAQIDGRPAGSTVRPNNPQETYVNEDGMTVLKYPEVGDYQMDILLITGKDMLKEYAEDGRLTSLNDSLNNTYKNIKKYIYNDILDNSMIDENWYAVPNNHMIGEYSLLLVNKEMAEKYYFKAEDLTTFGPGSSVQELMDLIAANEDPAKISPMYKMAEYPLVKYWTNGSTDKSVISTLVPTAGALLGNGVATANLFEDKSYRDFNSLMFYCKENGYFQTTQDDFGVAVIDADYSAFEKYGDDYYITVLSYPRLEDEAVFGSMFAVSSYTANANRSMEIITALTCSSELRNILQYGVEDVHYEIRDDGSLKRLNRDYIMNLSYTGNVMMAYPEEGMSTDIWETAIKQNQQSLLSMFYGSTEYLSNVDAEAWQQMCEVSVSYFKRMEECETMNEFIAYADAARDEIRSAEYYTTLTEVLDVTGNYITTSINGSIQKWWFDNFGNV